MDAAVPTLLAQSCAAESSCRPPQLRHWYGQMGGQHAVDGPKNMDVSLAKYVAVAEKVPHTRIYEARCNAHCETSMCDQLNGDVERECGACGEGYACSGVAGGVAGVGDTCDREHLARLAACVGVPLAGSLNYWETRDTPHTTPLHYDDSDNLLWVLRGRKRLVLLPPNASSAVLPTVIEPSIANHAADFGVVADVGKRGFGDSYWEDPTLAADAPPASALLQLFLEQYAFPPEALAH
eukprot:6822774-Prymnesium_polylepis.1